MKNLTLIIPAKNEHESLPLVLEELKKYDLKTKVVLSSEDQLTINAIQKFDIEIIYQKNKGYGDALIDGINSLDDGFFCIFNADGSFDPKELKQMYDKIIEKNYDFLFASRYEDKSGSEDDTFLTWLGNKIFTLLGKIIFSLNITDILYTFVIGKVSHYKKLNIRSLDFGFCVELPIMAKKNKMMLTTSPSYERKRIAGIKKVSEFRDGSLILLKMIKLIFRSK
ncbi:glycosyltransferase family 2 protein [Candidatus Pelagibacter sp. Uisw_092]|uniref:glycosyltransferase family 2 protein n=1 Tax=Candidatus Pelagibacter sp. Uisw_092 TaxID=3230979 RepID=UPI0039EC0D18